MKSSPFFYRAGPPFLQLTIRPDAVDTARVLLVGRAVRHVLDTSQEGACSRSCNAAATVSAIRDNNYLSDTGANVNGMNGQKNHGRFGGMMRYRSCLLYQNFSGNSFCLNRFRGNC